VKSLLTPNKKAQPGAAPKKLGKQLLIENRIHAVLSCIQKKKEWGIFLLLDMKTDQKSFFLSWVVFPKAYLAYRHLQFEWTQVSFYLLCFA
jgi:hypothetical protein